MVRVSVSNVIPLARNVAATKDRKPDFPELVADVRDAEHYNLARALLGADEPKPAMPILQGLVDRHPGDLRFQLFLAEACFATGEIERSKTLADGILARARRHPRASLAHAVLAEHYEEQGDDTRATFHRSQIKRA